MAERKETKFLYTEEEITQMQQMDVRMVDKETLVDIKDVQINTELPERERMIDFISQIKNPYCYLSKGVVVKISFAGKTTLEECLKQCICPK